MNRRDIPNLLGKRIQLIGLKTKPLNGKNGCVVDWNEERERFCVQFSDSSVKWFKPINLALVARPKNDNEEKLYLLIKSQKLLDLDHGMLLFEEIESTEENYDHTSMKTNWLSHAVLFKDKRCLPKVQKILKNIIENSKFEDLVVQAKISLCHCMMQQCRDEQYKTYLFELSMTCVENHYGRLPTIFNNLMATSNFASRLENGNHHETFQILKHIYDKSKTMIVNKTCAYGVKEDFLSIVFSFLTICKEYNLFENIPREASILRQILTAEIHQSGMNHLSFAQAYLFEQNFKDALYHLEQYQEFASTSFGNQCHFAIPTCYSLRIGCYIKLGNKTMANRGLQKLKTFTGIRHPELEKRIDDFQKSIDKMPDQKSNVTTKKVRTRVQCSFYYCKQIEPEVGVFKRCARCKLAYYCSRKHQKEHWRHGHKKECKC